MSVHVAVLGCGGVARRHARVARTLGSMIELSFASRSLERAEAYRRKFRGVAAFGSYEEACADPRVQAVFDCTPHAYRVENATLAARYKKHLLMEKPVARTMAELDAIESLARHAGILAMVAENYYFKPLVPVLREHIRRGDIGDPLFFELNRAARSGGHGWRIDGEMMGGGALLEGGVHWVNLLLEVGGQVSAAVAAKPTGAYRTTAPFEDGVEMLVRFTHGTVGKLLHSWNVTNRIGGLGMSRILGTDGNIHFESNGLFALVLGRRKRFRIPGVLDLMGYRGMLAHFVECVRDQRPPAMSLAVARRDLAVIFAAYRSLETGRFEPIDHGGGHVDDHESGVR